VLRGLQGRRLLRGERFVLLLLLRELSLLRGPMAEPLESIWKSFHGRLHRFVAGRVKNRADAEDVLQEVFVRVHQGVGALRDGERLLPWLFQVTRSAIADHYRKAARRREVPADGEPEPMAPHAAEDDPAQARRELAGCMRPMLERVPAAYREAVSLVELEGMTQTAAAKKLGLTVSGMKSRVQRGREKLKASLQGCCHVLVAADGGVVDYQCKRVGCPCGAACLG
jgi:RNA polymerase sigma-70 factor, ECF subfamily